MRPYPLAPSPVPLALLPIIVLFGFVFFAPCPIVVVVNALELVLKTPPPFQTCQLVPSNKPLIILPRLLFIARVPIVTLTSCSEFWSINKHIKSPAVKPVLLTVSRLAAPVALNNKCVLPAKSLLA